MAIENNAEGLKANIIAALEATTLSAGNISINETTGQIEKSDQTPALKHPLAAKNIKVTAATPVYQKAYGGDWEVGIDVMIDIIVREVLSYLQKNIEIVLKERYDSHENDFNAMLTAMALQGQTLSSNQVTAVFGATLTAIAAAAGETVAAQRSITKTTPLKILETTQIK